MKAILLAAGFGTRLRPLTDHTPKCLVEIQGKPLLQIWLENLTAAGINDILINSHYLSEQVSAFIDNSAFKSQVTLVHEPELLGTLGTLKANQRFWQDQNVLIAHADNLCLCDWQDFLYTFEQRPSDCVATMMLFETDNPQSCGIVELSNDSQQVSAQQRVVAFHEKVANPPSNLANGAIYCFDHRLGEIMASLPASASDISVDLVPLLLGRMTPWRTNGYLRDIGNLASLAKANAFMADYNHR